MLVTFRKSNKFCFEKLKNVYNARCYLIPITTGDQMIDHRYKQSIMRKKTNKTMKKIAKTSYNFKDFLDSDDELPTDYIEIPFVPAYLNDDRFGFIESEQKIIFDEILDKQKKVKDEVFDNKKKVKDEVLDNKKKVKDEVLHKKKKIGDKVLNKQKKKVCEVSDEQKKITDEVLDHWEKIVHEQKLLTDGFHMQQIVDAVFDNWENIVDEPNGDGLRKRKIVDAVIGKQKQMVNFFDLQRKTEINTDENIITHGYLNRKDTFCFQCLATTTSEKTLLWFYNFLMLKDLQSTYSFLTTCLVPNYYTDIY